MRTRFFRSSAKGFTLVETTVSAGIISTALIAVLGLFSASMSTSRDTRDMVGANLLARRMAAEATRADLMQNREVVVAAFDQALNLLETSAAHAEVEGWYEAGAPVARAALIVRMERIQPETGIIAAPRLVISVESPASAPAGRRKTHRYVTQAAD